jgi:flagellar secretion chaperone FliS
MSKTEMSYRKTAVEGASPIGLMIALFDTLVGDFRRAASAIRENDIETRCKELNHATLVLGRLESWVDLKNGGESAQILSRFYSSLRAKMMEASVTQSAVVLDTQIDTILHVRGAWQQLDTSTPPPMEKQVGPPVKQTNMAYPSMSWETPDRIPFSLSA